MYLKQENGTEAGHNGKIPLINNSRTCRCCSYLPKSCVLVSNLAMGLHHIIKRRNYTQISASVGMQGWKQRRDLNPYLERYGVTTDRVVYVGRMRD